ncbi:hypothetical protein JTB14_009382 [Gonioctena quinquepunctata]|nr:hypothetical protein JTB14_009382 [Gonioctena quinquepunctata]
MHWRPHRDFSEYSYISSSILRTLLWPYQFQQDLGVAALLFAEAGQISYGASEDIHTELSFIPWYCWNQKNQKILLNYLLHTSQPLNISPFPSLKVNRGMVVQGLRLVMSIIAVCRTLKGNDMAENK